MIQKSHRNWHFFMILSLNPLTLHPWKSAIKSRNVSIGGHGGSGDIGALIQGGASAGLILGVAIGSNAIVTLAKTPQRRDRLGPGHGFIGLEQLGITKTAIEGGLVFLG